MKAVSSVVISIALLGALSLPAQADSGMHDMPGMKDHKMSGMGDQMSVTHRGQGTVDKVDAQAGKVKISHGPIESLNWKGMTMVFQVKDAALLQGIEPGMKVDFEMEKVDGKYRIVSITPSK